MRVTLILHDYVDAVGRAQIIPIDKVIRGKEGNPCFVSRHHLFIATNLSYKDIIGLTGDIEVRGYIQYDRRKYSLIEVVNIKVITHKTTTKTEKIRKGETVELNGIKVYPALKTETVLTTKESTIIKPPNTVVSRKADSTKQSVTTVAILNTAGAEEVWLFDPLSGKFCYADESGMDMHGVDSVSEGALFELSKYYVVAFPLVIAKVGRKYRHRYALYYNGKKEIVRITSKRKTIPPLFRVQRACGGIPKGKIVKDWDEFTPLVKELHSHIRDTEVPSRTPLHPVEEFLLKYYIRPSKSVRKKLHTYYNLVETLRKYGYEARAEVAIRGYYSGVKIDDGIKLSKVKSTAIFLKAEVPERDRRLLDFLRSDRDRQLETLRKEVVDFVRFNNLSSEHDIIKSLANLPTQYEGVLGDLPQFIRRAKWITSDEITRCLNTLARIGLGSRPSNLDTALKVVRASVKYGLKVRGYTEKGEWRVKGDAEGLKRVLGNSRLSALLLDLAVPEEKGGSISVERIKLIN